MHDRPAIAGELATILSKRNALELLRLGQGDGSAEQSAPAVHLQIARRPDRRRADIGGEHGVVRACSLSRRARYCGWIGLCPGVPVREFVEPFAGFAVVGKAVVEMPAICLGLEFRQQRPDRGADIAHKAKVEFARRPRFSGRMSTCAIFASVGRNCL